MADENAGRPTVEGAMLVAEDGVWAGQQGSRIDGCALRLLDYSDAEPDKAAGAIFAGERRTLDFAVTGPAPFGFGALVLPPGYGVVVRVYITPPNVGRAPSDAADHDPQGASGP